MTILTSKRFALLFYMCNFLSSAVWPPTRLKYTCNPPTKLKPGNTQGGVITHVQWQIEIKTE